MSAYMEIVEADDANPNTIKKPAKRWRNWYWNDRETVDVQDNVYPPGPHCGVLSFPCRDTAESDAERVMADPVWRRLKTKYLGAFPEGERP